MYSKSCLPILLALSLNIAASTLNAGEEMPNCKKKTGKCNRLYVGGFGGELFSNASSMSQMGTALYPDGEGGPLAVEARGSTQKNNPGYGGAQIGYEWSRCVGDCRHWTLAPAAEIEGYWFSRHLKGNLTNTTDTYRVPEHDFIDTFHMKSGVYLANFILSLNNYWKLSPYVGVGIGATRISLRDAYSKQIAPLEAGINHFNSLNHAASWAFAAQVKAGLRYNFRRFHIFGEYRYLFVDFSNYIFGSTVYLTHPHTTPWNVNINSMKYNAFAFGVQFDLY